MRTKKLVEKEVVICDFCGKETEWASAKCLICGKEACDECRVQHFPYIVSVWRRKEQAWSEDSYICDQCAKRKVTGTWSDLLDNLYHKGEFGENLE